MQPQMGIWKMFVRSFSGVDRCSASARDLEEIYWKFIRCGQMQTQLGIWKRLIRSLLGVERCSLSWGSGRGLLEVYLGWTHAASAWDVEKVY